jgi:hypothetical protein
MGTDRTGSAGLLAAMLLAAMVRDGESDRSATLTRELDAMGMLSPAQRAAVHEAAARELKAQRTGVQAAARVLRDFSPGGVHQAIYLDTSPAERDKSLSSIHAMEPADLLDLAGDLKATSHGLELLAGMCVSTGLRRILEKEVAEAKATEGAAPTGG